MKSPKPATDNRFKKLIKSYLWNRTMLNFCGIVVTILKMETSRNFSMSGINSGLWIRTMLNLCGIVVAILKMSTDRNFSMSGHHYLPTYKILMILDNVEFLPPIFYAVFWQPFWKCRLLENLENAELLL
jgi:hypothetical protein